MSTDEIIGARNAPPPVCNIIFFFLWILSFGRAKFRKVFACLLNAVFSRFLSGTFPLKMFKAHSHTDAITQGSALFKYVILSREFMWLRALRMAAVFWLKGLLDPIARMKLHTHAHTIHHHHHHHHHHLSWVIRIGWICVGKWVGMGYKNMSFFYFREFGT